MSFITRTMSRQEVELALGWAAAEGWNPGLSDATPFQVADPAGFLVGLVDDDALADGEVWLDAVEVEGGVVGLNDFVLITPHGASPC